MRTLAIGATCAIAGAGAGIAGSSASTPNPSKEQLKRGGLRAFKAGIAPGPMLGLAGDAAGPPVHSESVVPNEKGGFDTVTMDQGAFSSLSGEQLTITEGTKSATYKTVTLSIPSDANVSRNGEKAQLSDIKSGDTVIVVQSPTGTFVNAFDAAHAPQVRVASPGPGGPEGMKKLEGSPPPQPAPEGAGAPSAEQSGEAGSPN
jgi:hypothetical protein